MDKSKLMNYSKAQLVEMLVKETATVITTPTDALAPILKELDKFKFKEIECFICIWVNRLIFSLTHKDFQSPHILYLLQVLQFFYHRLVEEKPQQYQN